MKRLTKGLILAIIICSSFSTSAFAIWEMKVEAEPEYLIPRLDSKQTSTITVTLTNLVPDKFSSSGRFVTFIRPLVGEFKDIQPIIITDSEGRATATYVLPANTEPQVITIEAEANLPYSLPPEVIYTLRGEGKVYVIEVELKATDTNTTAEGIRKSTTELVMVDTGARTADIKLSVDGTLPPGYPTWSGTGVTGTAENLTATYSGTSDSNVKCTVTKDYVESLKIDIVDELKFEASWNFNEKELKAIKDALNRVIKKISKKDVVLEISDTTLSVEFKRVDKYNDGDNYGYFADISGTVTATFPDVEFYSPPITTGIPGVSVAVGGGFEASSMSLSGETLYDQSKKNEGEVKGTLSASTTSTLGAKVVVGVEKIASITFKGTGKTTLSASGKIHKTGKDIKAKYDVGADDFTITGDVKLRLLSGEFRIAKIKPYEFNFNATKTGTVTLYSFK